MQCTEPEIDYIAPQIKLRDEMCDFIDGKWVNESSCQPPFVSHQKLISKKAQNEWSIWEENRVLWEKNQLLQIQNRMLWEENKALQCLQSHNNINVVNTDAVQQSLQKENELFSFFQERNIGFQVSPSHKALQMVQEINGVLDDFQEENKTVPISFKDQKAITVQEESKDSSSDLQKDAATITDVEEGNPGPAPWQEHKVKKKSTTPTQNKIKSAPGIQGDYEILRALQDLYHLLHIFLKMNHLLGEKQGCHILYEVNRSFQEDYNKLKMQLNAVKNTVSEITAQMEILERELIDITSPVYEDTGEMLATEHQPGEM